MALVNPNHPIHPEFHERISVKVQGQLPAFVKEDHTTFVAFMEAYYEYMEQQGKAYEIIGNLHNYANVDKTTDEFLKYFKKQFGEDIPEAVFENANRPFVIKHLRDFYRTKGSEKSFQFLFRLLYKEEIDFYYPGDDMLRVSDGRYNTSQIIRVIDSSGTDAIFTTVGKKITGASSGTTAIVETVLNENIGRFFVSTMFLSGVVGVFTVGEIISDGTNSFTTGGMITDYTITTPGNNYTVGSVVPITGGGGSAGGSFVKISELSTGSITSYNIISGGSNYVVGDKLTFNNLNTLALDGRTASILVKKVDVSSGAITELEIEHGGRGYTSIPTISGGGTGTNANITLSGYGIGGIKTLDINNGGYGYSVNGVLDFSSIGDGTATGIAFLGGYEDSYQRGFTSNDGFLSAPKYIQDSRYYQTFSYVIRFTGYTIDKWRAPVKRLAHPAGLALFGNLEIISLISTGIKITGIPQRKDYKIIFHSGSVPPVILDLKVDSCEGRTLIFYPITTDDQEDGDTELDNNNITSTEDDGLITQPAPLKQDDGSIVRKFYYKATKCQIYEKDLAIQYLDKFSKEDYRFALEAVTEEPNPNLDDGLITENVLEFEDWGDLFSKSQLRLGPLRRTIERQKFNKFGGFSQIIGNAPTATTPTGTQSGSILSHFQNLTTDDFVMSGGLKTRNVMNTTVTQYPINAEVHNTDPVANTNPTGGVGTFWYNTVSGEKFICTDATTDANVWTIDNNAFQTVNNTARLTGYTGHPDEPNEDNIGTGLEGVPVAWEPQTNDPTPAQRVLPPSE